MDEVLIPNVEDLIAENPAVVSFLVRPCYLKRETESSLEEGLISGEYVSATLSEKAVANR